MKILLLLILAFVLAPAQAKQTQTWQSHMAFVEAASKLPATEADFRRSLAIPFYISHIQFSPLLGKYQRLKHTSEHYLARGMSQQLTLAQQLNTHAANAAPSIPLSNAKVPAAQAATPDAKKGENAQEFKRLITHYQTQSREIKSQLIKLNMTFNSALPLGTRLIAIWGDIETRLGTLHELTTPVENTVDGDITQQIIQSQWQAIHSKTGELTSLLDAQS